MLLELEWHVQAHALLHSQIHTITPTFSNHLSPASFSHLSMLYWQTRRTELGWCSGKWTCSTNLILGNIFYQYAFCCVNDLDFSAKAGVIRCWWNITSFQTCCGQPWMEPIPAQASREAPWDTGHGWCKCTAHVHVGRGVAVASSRADYRAAQQSSMERLESSSSSIISSTWCSSKQLNSTPPWPFSSATRLVSSLCSAATGGLRGACTTTGCAAWRESKLQRCSFAVRAADRYLQCDDGGRWGLQGKLVFARAPHIRTAASS